MSILTKKKNEKGGYYVNDDGQRVEWEEVHNWLIANDSNLTDQNEEWGDLNIFVKKGQENLSGYATTANPGHAWIQLESSDGKIKTFGLFPGKQSTRDAEPEEQAGNMFQINYERYFAYVYLGDENKYTSGKTKITKNNDY